MMAYPGGVQNGAAPTNDKPKSGKSPKEQHLAGKIILLGSQGVGKSSILAQQTGDYMVKVLRPTIAMDYSETSLHLSEIRAKKGDKVKNVDIWLKLKCFDTAGQERFRSIVNSYYRDAVAAIIVYDITRIDSFKDLNVWMDELKKRSSVPVVFCIVGNKLDLALYRKIERWTAEYFASSCGALYFETSAFRNTGIDEVFSAIAHEIVARGLAKPEGKEEEKKKSCCSFG